MKALFTALLLGMASAGLFSQVAPQKYFIEFIDKYNSPYSVSRPGEFLTERAIQRRERQGIQVGEDDLPVNQTYVNRILQLGVTVLTRSKWFNGVTVYCLNPALIDSISEFPFVKHVRLMNCNNSLNESISINNSKLNKPNDYVDADVTYVNYKCIKSDSRSPESTTGYDYGQSYRQIQMLGGDSLHKLGYKGEGMVIAVLDGGFYHVDQLPAFDSLRLNGRILGTRDFVRPGNNVYNESEHGMEVLSCMGGNLPGQLVGTAPKSSYWLLRSEDVASEFLIEEYNWISAAEFADSVGADVINSSLGYTVFNDPLQDHTCLDMNGNTTPVTRGANIAVAKGMIVVNSAGNSGTTGWKCVSAPADGYDVMAVAAVDSNGLRADFSSRGVSTGRIKPNVASMGRAAVVSSTVGPVMRSSGTSFASPILAGVIACIWQASPSMKCRQVTRAVELSGNQAEDPDSLLGFGIPNAIRALKVMGVPGPQEGIRFTVIPNPFNGAGDVILTCRSPLKQVLKITVLGSDGRALFGQTSIVLPGENNIRLTGLPYLANGLYLVHLSGEHVNSCGRLMVNSN